MTGFNVGDIDVCVVGLTEGITVGEKVGVIIGICEGDTVGYCDDDVERSGILIKSD